MQPGEDKIVLERIYEKFFRKQDCQNRLLRKHLLTYRRQMECFRRILIPAKHPIPWILEQDQKTVDTGNPFRENSCNTEIFAGTLEGTI